MSVQLTAGMRANLFSLQQTTKMMDLTQKRLSTGKKVNTALDDPVNFFKSKDHMTAPPTWPPRKTVCPKPLKPSRLPIPVSRPFMICWPRWNLWHPPPRLPTTPAICRNPVR